jgi:N6-L-threonylcarbamoyladenine synthase
LCKKSKVAFKEFKKNNKSKKNTFVIAGGVASNKSIRQKLIDLSLKEKFDPIFPPINLCSDNAAMIAMVGLEKYKLGLTNQLDFPAKPRWPLDENAAFLKGAGVKL